jgi:hypothetical protein
MTDGLNNSENVSNGNDFLKNLLEKPPLKSKKFIMAVTGLAGIGVMFITGFVMMIIMPPQSTQIQGICQVAMTAWGTLAGLAVGAQGVQDYVATTSITTTTTQ